MAAIKSSNTKPELAVRRMLHAMGFRFRLHCKELPGRPDIVLPKFRTVVFVNGCFWHQHPGCRFAYKPSTRQTFWDLKLARNVERDRENVAKLSELGWKVAIVWECELKDVENLAKRVTMLLQQPFDKKQRRDPTLVESL